MYVQKQESALGVNCGEFFPLLGKQLKQYAECQLQGKISNYQNNVGSTSLDAMMVRGGQ